MYVNSTRNESPDEGSAIRMYDWSATPQKLFITANILLGGVLFFDRYLNDADIDTLISHLPSL